MTKNSGSRRSTTSQAIDDPPEPPAKEGLNIIRVSGVESLFGISAAVAEPIVPSSRWRLRHGGHQVAGPRFKRIRGLIRSRRAGGPAL